MGICAQKSDPVINFTPERQAIKLVHYFYNIAMLQYPDIDTIIKNKLESQKIIERKIAFPLIEEIVLFLNQLKFRNHDQDVLLDHLNYVYQNSFKKFQHYSSELGEFILITVIEVLLCFKSLEQSDLTPMDVWWVNEHFQWRYKLLNQQYQVEYDDFLNSSYMVKFLYLLKECVRIEMKKIQQANQNTNQQRNDTLHEIPNTARTADSFKPKQRIDTI